MPDAPSGLTRLDRLLPALEGLSGAKLRVWTQANGSRPETPEGGGGEGGAAWLERVPDTEGVWLEIRDGDRTKDAAARRALGEIVGAVLASEREAAQVAGELSERYEEIDLIYTISEILGHTIRLDEAAQRIVTEVSTVVRAQRATLLVFDEERRVLRLVAARGIDPEEIDPRDVEAIELEDDCSVAARAFREGRIIAYDPRDAAAENLGCGEGRRYKGKAFLSVPVLYGAPGQPSRPIGVINLTDRLGEDAFTAGDRKLVAAVANQIGAAIENARLAARDLGQQQMRRELELARDLQLKLLPSPLVVAARADVAARCRQAESVGGDFYNLLNLPGDRIGVMIGDVTSHGFGAALIMALAMAASGIHAEAADSPTEALRRLEESLADELARTEMFLTLFYGVFDPRAGRVTFANAGHPHAWTVDGASGQATRLDATRPPLGLAAALGQDTVRPWRAKGDVLCLFTDGIADALSETGARFGEERVLAHVRALRDRHTRDILEAIYADVAAFTGGVQPADDRTVVLLKV